VRAGYTEEEATLQVEKRMLAIETERADCRAAGGQDRLAVRRRGRALAASAA
jgi:hypothetical protein